MNMPQEQAIEMLEARMRDNPKSLVFARLADMYLDQGRIDDAIALCNESVKHHQYYVTGHFVLAKAFIARKDLEKAEGALKKVLSHDQQYPAAHKLLGDILCKTNRDSLAGAHYEDVLAMDPLEEKVRKALERIPKETPEAVPPPISVPKPKIEPVVPSRPSVEAETTDESWMDQIKEFRPEETAPPAGKTDAQTGAAADETEIADPFADLVLFDEREKEAAPDGGPAPAPETAQDLSEETAAGQGEGSPETEPLIGESPENLTVETEEAPSPYLTSEMLPEKPSETGEPLGLERLDAEPFNVALTGIADTEESLEEEHGFHAPPANEPGLLDTIDLSSEPTLLDDFPAAAEPAAGTYDIQEEPPPPPKKETAAPPPPQPVSPPLEAKPISEKKLPKIVTPTLGEIYAVQGQYEKAILVYQALLEKTPGEKKFLDKIEEMRKKLKESAGK
jgi:tetratricopeptide (TPR) repeat protein